MTTEPPEGFEPEPMDPMEPSEPAVPMEPAEIEAEAEVEAEESDFSSGEGMVALGGAVIALVFVIFEFFLEDYAIGSFAMVLAITAILLPRIDRDFVEKVAPLPVSMKLLGYLLAIAGVLAIIGDLRGDTFDQGGGAVFGALGAYAGYAIAFLGARSIDT